MGCGLFLNPFACHAQTKSLQANNARRPTPQNSFLISGRGRGTPRLQVAQPAGELCIQASSSSPSTVTISREEDVLSDAQPVSSSKTAGRSVSYEAAEQASFSGRVATVSFQGRTGRSGSFGLDIDSNRSRLRRRLFAELRMHLDDGQNMQPILLGRRRRIIEEERKKAEDAQRRRMAEARRQQLKDRAAAAAASSLSASSSAMSSSTSPGSQAPSGKISPGTKPKGIIPKDAVGNVVAHNLDLKPSKTTKVIPEGFAIRIQTVSRACVFPCPVPVFPCDFPCPFLPLSLIGVRFFLGTFFGALLMFVSGLLPRVPTGHRPANHATRDGRQWRSWPGGA